MKNGNFWILILLALSACSNSARPQKQVVGPSSRFTADTVSVASPDQYILDVFGYRYPSDFKCPTTPNILPEEDLWLDGSGRYTACRSKNLSQNLTFYFVGRAPEETDSLCLIPATYVSNPNEEWTKGYHVFRDLQSNAPADRPIVAQCILALDHGGNVDFRDQLSLFRDPVDPTKPLRIDAFFVIDSRDYSSMVSCLNSGIPQMCPNYSFGTLR